MKNDGFILLLMNCVNRRDKAVIIKTCEATKHDLIALCAYEEAEAVRTFEVLDGYILG